MKYLIILTLLLTACTITEPIQPVAQQPTPEEAESVRDTTLLDAMPDWVKLETGDVYTQGVKRPYLRVYVPSTRGFDAYVGNVRQTVWCPAEDGWTYTLLIHELEWLSGDTLTLIKQGDTVEVWREWLIVQNENGE